MLTILAHRRATRHPDRQEGRGLAEGAAEHLVRRAVRHRESAGLALAGSVQGDLVRDSRLSLLGCHRLVSAPSSVRKGRATIKQSLVDADCALALVGE